MGKCIILLSLFVEGLEGAMIIFLPCNWHLICHNFLMVHLKVPCVRIVHESWAFCRQEMPGVVHEHLTALVRRSTGALNFKLG